MSGFIDLHSHYVPAVDDGVRTHDEGVALCRGLASLGFVKCVATPHIRTAKFENRKPGLRAAHASFVEDAREAEGMPELGLGAEHWFDDVFWRLFQEGEALPYPGGKAALVEFPRDALPLRVEHVFFQMQVAGVKPVLAHPERYRPLFKKTEPIDPLLEAGALPLLDVMSLIGKYGRRPRKAAERMLADGVYYAACSDAHRPKDVAEVAKGIERLRKLVGDEETDELLRIGPSKILDGSAEM